jgi:hypothetical protein
VALGKPQARGANPTAWRLMRIKEFFGYTSLGVVAATDPAALKGYEAAPAESGFGMGPSSIHGALLRSSGIHVRRVCHAYPMYLLKTIMSSGSVVYP